MSDKIKMSDKINYLERDCSIKVISVMKEIYEAGLKMLLDPKYSGRFDRVHVWHGHNSHNICTVSYDSYSTYFLPGADLRLIPADMVVEHGFETKFYEDSIEIVSHDSNELDIKTARIEQAEGRTIRGIPKVSGDLVWCDDKLWTRMISKIRKGSEIRAFHRTGDIKIVITADEFLIGFVLIVKHNPPITSRNL